MTQGDLRSSWCCPGESEAEQMWQLPALLPDKTLFNKVHFITLYKFYGKFLARASMLPEASRSLPLCQHVPAEVLATLEDGAGSQQHQCVR